MLQQVLVTVNTTLGRIGLGYLYTDFQPQVAWTLPDLGNGFGAKVAIFDPDDVAADTAAFSVQQINHLQELKLKLLGMVIF